MFYTDSHIHLHDCNPEIIKNVITNAKKNKVEAFVNVSSVPDDWDKVIEIAQKYSGVRAAIGVHPWCAENVFPHWDENLEKYLQKYPDLWVGECGIDRLKNHDTAIQEKVFLRQAELAKKYNRTLIVHAVKANEQIEKLFAYLPQKTIFHSFTGSKEWGKQIQSRGFYLGVNCTILNKKNADELLKNVDLNLLLLETDFPYQGKNTVFENKPSYLPLLAEKIAQANNRDTEQVAEKLWQNWLNLVDEREK